MRLSEHARLNGHIRPRQAGLKKRLACYECSGYQGSLKKFRRSRFDKTLWIDRQGQGRPRSQIERERGSETTPKPFWSVGLGGTFLGIWMGDGNYKQSNSRIKEVW